MRKLKDSGIEWIGLMPEDWEISRFRYLYDIIGGNGFKENLQGKDSGEFPFYKVSDINGGGIYVETANNYVEKTDVDEQKYSVVPKNSLLIAKIGEALKKNHRKISLSDCIIDNNMQALVPLTNLNSIYFYYQWLCIDMNWFDNGGTIPSVNNQRLKDFNLIYPNISEQQRISKYLDHKCAEIDSVIKAKQTTNEKLKEYRQSVIYEAVTKGLDKDVIMKDSGVEWIGDIPEKWKVKKLSYLYDIIGSGTTPPTSNSVYYDGEINWVNTGDLNDGYLYETKKTVTDEALSDFSVLKEYEENSIIIAMYGATIGKVSIAKCKFVVNQACCVLSVPLHCNSKYVYYWLIQNKEILISLSYGGGQPNISQETIRSLKIQIPNTIEEQNRISDYLDRQCAEIDMIFAANTKTIEKLKEYRQSVIYEAVTGKVEV